MNNLKNDEEYFNFYNNSVSKYYNSIENLMYSAITENLKSFILHRLKSVDEFMISQGYFSLLQSNPVEFDDTQLNINIISFDDFLKKVRREINNV